jgi:hypothetical protein
MQPGLAVIYPRTARLDAPPRRTKQPPRHRKRQHPPQHHLHVHHGSLPVAPTPHTHTRGCVPPPPPLRPPLPTKSKMAAMRVSRLFAPGAREVPADAATPGHQLLLRAGFLRKASARPPTLFPVYRTVPESRRGGGGPGAVVRGRVHAAAAGAAGAGQAGGPGGRGARGDRSAHALRPVTRSCGGPGPDRWIRPTGAHKLAMPTLLAADLWKQTGRWQSSGAEARGPSAYTRPLTAPATEGPVSLSLSVQ